MAETTTATSWPASTSRLTWRATLRMRSMSATEVPPNFITRRAMAGTCGRSGEQGDRRRRFSRKPAAPKRRVYIPADGLAGLQPRPSGATDWRDQDGCGAAAPTPPSTRPRSRAFRRWPPSGGTRAARWRCCTSSIRCGSAYIRDSRVPRIRPRRQAARLPEGPAHPRHRLRRRHSVASRWRGSAPRWSAPIRRRPTSRPRRLHAAQSGLAVDYRATTAEALAEPASSFDVVLAMEVVEHVADVKLFVATLRRRW